MPPSCIFFSEWDKDWMPAKYPETEAERRAAAKKYGLLPEDYTPLPNDGTGHGDYPQFPLIGEEQKDPYEDWDDPVLKRNFGEPVSHFLAYSLYLFMYKLILILYTTEQNV